MVALPPAPRTAQTARVSCAYSAFVRDSGTAPPGFLRLVRTGDVVSSHVDGALSTGYFDNLTLVR